MKKCCWSWVFYRLFYSIAATHQHLLLRQSNIRVGSCSKIKILFKFKIGNAPTISLYFGSYLVFIKNVVKRHACFNLHLKDRSMTFLYRNHCLHKFYLFKSWKHINSANRLMIFDRWWLSCYFVDFVYLICFLAANGMSLILFLQFLSL